MVTRYTPDYTSELFKLFPASLQRDLLATFDRDGLIDPGKFKIVCERYAVASADESGLIDDAYAGWWESMYGIEQAEQPCRYSAILN